MRLRTKIIVGFLLLSILPLAGIVLASYLSSIHSFERAVEAESREMTAEINRQMDRMKADFGRQVARLGLAPMLTGEEELPMPDERLIEEIERRLAAEAPWLDALAWVPEDSQALEMPMVIEIERSEVVAPEGEEPAEGGVRVSFKHMAPSPPPAPPGATPHPDPREHLESAAVEIAERIEEVSGRLAEKQEQTAKAAERATAGDYHTVLDRSLELSALEEELRALEGKRWKVKELLGTDFASEIRAGDRIVGQLHPQVSVSDFVTEVLARARPMKGEVAFAVDPEGTLYTSTQEERGLLEPIEDSIVACVDDEGARTISVAEGWMLVTQRDPDSSLIFGIARPIGEALAEMQRAAARNFGLGVGMIGLALIGIVPLSSRMTRRINHLSERARLLASGDLGVRADDRGSSDEIGELARVFNRMAEELTVNQQRLVEQELQQRLLESEHERKSAELEEARRFQLSLLPRDLPEVEGADVAVFMKTATEVGGDYYDFQIDDGSGFTVAIGDATGHGARAGTMVTVIKSLFAARASQNRPDAFLAEASQAIRSMRLERMTMALALLRFERDASGAWSLLLSSAAMPPVVVHRTDGSLEELVLQGLPLGAMGEASYETSRVALRDGDCVLLMSDGFPELPSPTGEVYGYQRVHDRLRSFAAGGPRATIERLAAEVERWTEGQPPADDVTFVVVRIGEAAGKPPLDRVSPSTPSAD